MNTPFILGIHGLRFSIESVFLDQRGQISLLLACGVGNLSGLLFLIFKVRTPLAVKCYAFTYQYI